MNPFAALLDPTFMVSRSALHQLCCEEASRSERRYHTGKHLLLSLATDEEIKNAEVEQKQDVFIPLPDCIREKVRSRVFPKFFGHPRGLGLTDDLTDGVPRLCNAVDLVSGTVRPEGTKLFPGITYFFTTVQDVAAGQLKLMTTRSALASGIRAVLVEPWHTGGRVEVALSVSACVEIKPDDNLIKLAYGD